ELDEFYSLAECETHRWAQRAFARNFQHFAPGWRSASVDVRRAFIMRALDALESSSQAHRRCAMASLAHIAQGVWTETANAEEQEESVIENSLLLADCGAVGVVVAAMRVAVADQEEWFVRDGNHHSPEVGEPGLFLAPHELSPTSDVERQVQ